MMGAIAWKPPKTKRGHPKTSDETRPMNYSMARGEIIELKRGESIEVFRRDIEKTKCPYCGRIKENRVCDGCGSAT